MAMFNCISTGNMDVNTETFNLLRFNSSITCDIADAAEA